MIRSLRHKGRVGLALAILLGSAFLVFSQDNPTPGVHATTPGLTGAEAQIDLTSAEAMVRAKEALVAAGLTPHAPLTDTIGGSNAWVWAIINCTRSGDGKSRVIVSVASNPERRGESYRVCMFLMDYIKTGKVPADAPFKNFAGVYEWAWANHIGGTGKSKVTLHPDGKATCEGENWGPTIWWADSGKVFVYFPSPFPKENLQYVCQFAISPDGRTMTMPANYYYRSVTATRIGDVPGASLPTTSYPPVDPPANPPSTTENPKTSLSATLGVSEDDIFVRFDAPTYKPGPLPLPAVGAMLAKKTLAPAPEDGQGTELVSVKAVHVPHRDLPNEASGDLLVEVQLSDVGSLYVAHVYVGGYLAAPRDGSGGGRQRQGVSGITYDGHVPAYEYKRLHSLTDEHSPQPGKLRRYQFQMPDVLPADIRVELYRQEREGEVLVGTKSTTFNMPFEDYKLEQGVVVGKTGSKITKIVALASKGVTEVLYHMPFSATRPNTSSFDFRRRGRLTQEHYFTITVTADYDVTPETPWREFNVYVWPNSRDRDQRNNRLWPNLPNLGYQDREPIYRWAPGGSALLAILER